MWFWLAVIAGLASAIDKVLVRIAVRNKANVMMFSLLYLAGISLFALLFSFPWHIQFTPQLAGLVLLQALFWTASSLGSFLSQSKTDVSLSMIISRARMIWLIPMGFMFLEERLSSMTIVGTALIFGGLAILFFKTGKIHRHKGVQLMMVSSVLAAAGTVVNTILLRGYLTPAQVTFTTQATQALVFLFIVIARGNVVSRLAEMTRRAGKIIVMASGVEAFAFITLGYALKIGLASVVTAIYLAMSMVTIWIGVWWLHEKDHVWKKVISSAVVTAGIILLRVFA